MYLFLYMYIYTRLHPWPKATVMFESDVQMCIFKRNVVGFDFVMFLIVFRLREEKFEKGFYGVGKSIWIWGSVSLCVRDWTGHL